MKFVKTFESFSSLTEEQKIKLQTIVEEIKENSTEKVGGNSEVANPRGKARNPFYDRGSRKLDGLGQSYASIIPGSVTKEKGIIYAEVKHGMKYESGLTKDYKSCIEMDEKTLEYTTKKLGEDL